MARPDNCDSRLRKPPPVSAYIKDDRGIVDFSQTAWITGIIERDDLRARGLRFLQFLLRE
jgi:hypothetical protein